MARKGRRLVAAAALAALTAGAIGAVRVAPILMMLRDIWSLDSVDPHRRGVVVEERDIGLEVPADLYLDSPGAHPGGALLLVHGLLHDGKRDSRLRGLATVIAARGVAVLVPEFPAMKQLKVRREEIGEIAHAFGALRWITGARRCGMVGFSYGAGPTLLALREPEVAGSLDLLVLFGAYHDLATVVAFQTTGERAATDAPAPDPRARWYFLGANADLVGEPKDRESLGEIARRRQASPAADVGGLASRLGPEGARFYALLENRDPARTQELLVALGPGISSLLTDLSPSRAELPELNATVLLIHARSDALIPYSESLELAREIRTRGPLRVILMGSFSHVGPAESGEGGIGRLRRIAADGLGMASVCKAVLALGD